MYLKTSKRKIFSLTILVLFFKIHAQTNNSPVCSINSNKIIGEWVNIQMPTKTTSLDSINKILKDSKNVKLYNTEITKEFHLDFSKDSLTYFGTTVKYHIDSTSCNLITLTNPKTKKTRSQKIYVITDKFLVLQDCNYECFTMFYIKLK